jgi:hypothetical protein
MVFGIGRALKGKDPQAAPTSFQSAPGFAQEGFEELVRRGGDISRTQFPANPAIGGALSFAGGGAPQQQRSSIVVPTGQSRQSGQSSRTDQLRQAFAAAPPGSNEKSRLQAAINEEISNDLSIPESVRNLARQAGASGGKGSSFQQKLLDAQLAKLPASNPQAAGFRGDFAAGAGSPSSSSSSSPRSQERSQSSFPVGSSFAQGLSDLEQARGRISGMDRFIDQAGQNIQRFVDPITGEEIQTGINQFLNPFTQEVIDPALDDLRRAAAIQRGDVGSQFTQSGAFGSSRQGLAEGLIGEAATREAGRLAGQLRSQGFESAADRALNNLLAGRARFGQGAQLNLGQAGQHLAGTNALQNLATRQFGAAELGERLGALPVQRAAERLGLGEAALDAQLRGQTRPLGVLQSALGSVPVGGGSALAGQQGAIGQAAGDLFGKAASAGGDAAAGADFGSIFAALGGSDERLKENINLVSKENGFNIYEYNYKGCSGRYRGVMAQEVIKTVPSAVRKIGDYLAVDYDQIGIKLSEVA